MSLGKNTFSRREAMALGAFLCLSGTAKGAVSITDVLGRKVDLPRAPQRIIVAFYLEEFTAIGGAAGWERVAGFRKHQWAVNRANTYRHFVQAIPRLDALPDVGAGEGKLLIAEKALAERPDLVIVPPWALTTDRDQLQPLEAAGIPYIVVDYNAQSIEKHVASTLAIGKAIGAEARAEEIAQLYTRRMAEIRERAMNATSRPKIYIEIGWLGAGEFGSTYKNTMWGRHIDFIGAVNIANDAMPGASGFNPIAPEKILAANPDHIFITGSSWADRPHAVRLGYDVDEKTARDTLRPYIGRPGWSELQAVKKARVYTVEHSLIRSLTDWISLQYIAKQIYPEQFKDIDPEISLREFHERFLPVKYRGTWFASLGA